MATVGQPGASAMVRITVHHANSHPRTSGEENFEELEDIQEALLRSILDEANSNPNQGESSSGAAATSGVDEQIASDFEYAKQLQEEMEFSIQGDDISGVPAPSYTDDDEDDHEDNEEEAERHEDNDNPDNTTYEQGDALVESVGTESRGLSDELISFLEPWKYKESGFFSRETNCENCTICLDTFKHGESLITLPCIHHYHADCITTWLKIRKTCPVCKCEVFGP